MPRKVKETKTGRSRVSPPGEHDDDTMEVDPQEQESDMECAEAAASAEKKTIRAPRILLLLLRRRPKMLLVRRRPRMLLLRRRPRRRRRRTRRGQPRTPRPNSSHPGWSRPWAKPLLMTLLMRLVSRLVTRLVTSLVRLVRVMVVRIQWLARLPRVVAKVGRRLSQINSPTLKKTICASGTKTTHTSTTKHTRVTN